MYAAAKAKPQSIEVEHLGPAPISGPHLVATYKPGRAIYAQGKLNDKCKSTRIADRFGTCLQAIRRLRFCEHNPKRKL